MEQYQANSMEGWLKGDIYGGDYTQVRQEFAGPVCLNVVGTGATSSDFETVFSFLFSFCVPCSSFKLPALSSGPLAWAFGTPRADNKSAGPAQVQVLLHVWLK